MIKQIVASEAPDHDTLADWIAAIPPSPCQRFVDYRHGRSAGRVVFQNPSAPQHRNPHGSEVAGTNSSHFRSAKAVLGVVIAQQLSGKVCLASQRSDSHDGCGIDAWQTLDSRQQLLLKVPYLVGGKIPGAANRSRHGQQIPRIESQFFLVQTVETFTK